MNRYLHVLAFILVMPPMAMATSENVVTIKSAHTFEQTLTRVESTAKEKGFVVFGRLDHAAAARAVGEKMPASTVLVIGNPKVGTERFVKFPTYAIDLPLKVLVWDNEKGATSVSYNAAAFMLDVNQRHGLPKNDTMEQAAKRTEDIIGSIVKAATQ